MPGTVGLLPPSPARRPRVLVAEDNAGFRAVVVELLGDEGFEVVAVADGGAGWSRLQAGEVFDLLLFDDDMPGMRGLDLVTRLRGQGLTTPIVIASGSLTMSESERDRLGLFAVLPKPIKAAELVSTLRAALEGQS